MFGYIPTGWDTRNSIVNNGDSYKSLGAQWHADANQVVQVSPRLAARVRDVARALEDLAFLCAQMRRDDKK